MYKKINSDFTYLSNQGDTAPEILTKYLAKKERAYSKARNAANSSNLANRRAKFEFFNSLREAVNKKKREN